MSETAPFDINVEFKELSALERQLRDASNYGIRNAMRAGFEAMGEVIAERARDIAPRDIDGIRSAASLAQGPLHMNTTYRATSDYVDIVAPGYAKYVDEGQYLLDAIEDQRDKAVRAFGEAAADEIGVVFGETPKQDRERREIVGAEPAAYSELVTHTLVESLALGLGFRWAFGNPKVRNLYGSAKRELARRGAWIHRTGQVGVHKPEKVISGQRWQSWGLSRRMPNPRSMQPAETSWGRVVQWSRGWVPPERQERGPAPISGAAIGRGLNTMAANPFLGTAVRGFARLPAAALTTGRRLTLDTAKVPRAARSVRRALGPGWWKKPQPVSKPVLTQPPVFGAGNWSPAVSAGRVRTGRVQMASGRFAMRVGAAASRSGAMVRLGAGRAAVGVASGAGYAHKVAWRSAAGASRFAARSADATIRGTQRRAAAGALRSASFLQRRVVWRASLDPHRRAVGGATPQPADLWSAARVRMRRQAARLIGRQRPPANALLEPRFDVYGGWAKRTGRGLDRFGRLIAETDPDMAEFGDLYRVYGAMWRGIGSGTAFMGRGFASGVSGVRRWGFAARDRSRSPLGSADRLRVWGNAARSKAETDPMSALRVWGDAAGDPNAYGLGTRISVFGRKMVLRGQIAEARRREQQLIADRRYAELWRQQSNIANWMTRREQGWEQTLQRGQEYSMVNAFTRTGEQHRPPFAGFVATVRARRMINQFDTRPAQRARLRYEDSMEFWRSTRGMSGSDYAREWLRRQGQKATRETRWAVEGVRRGWQRLDVDPDHPDIPAQRRWRRNLSMGMVKWEAETGETIDLGPLWEGYKANIFQRNEPQINLPLLFPGRNWFNLQLGVARRKAEKATDAISAAEELARPAASDSWFGLRERLNISVPFTAKRGKITLRFAGPVDMRGRAGAQNIVGHRSSLLIRREKRPITSAVLGRSPVVGSVIRRATPERWKPAVNAALDAPGMSSSPSVAPWMSKPPWYSRAVREGWRMTPGSVRKSAAEAWWKRRGRSSGSIWTRYGWGSDDLTDPTLGGG